jgi:hypothetical protein
MRALVVDLGNHVLVVHRRGISYNVSFLNVELHLPDFHGGTFRISFPEIPELGQVSTQLAAGIGLGIRTEPETCKECPDVLFSLPYNPAGLGGVHTFDFRGGRLFGISSLGYLIV